MSILVIKIGGSLDITNSLLENITAYKGPMVIVHGGNRQLDKIARQFGHPPKMITSEHGEVSRYTDSKTMDYFLMAYAGKVNKRIVEALQSRKVNAVGLTAMDGGIAKAERKPVIRLQENGKVKVLRENHVGTIKEIDASLINLLLAQNYLPVLTPPAISYDGVAVNVDGDRLVMEIAVALEAEKLVIFSDTPGFLRDVDDPTSVIRRINLTSFPEQVQYARGRAQIKLRSAVKAVERGIETVILADGTIDQPLTVALGGQGTWITSS